MNQDSTDAAAAVPPVAAASPPPVGQLFGSGTVTATARYRWRIFPQQLSQAVTMITTSPVQPPDRTYSSATDAPRTSTGSSCLPILASGGPARAAPQQRSGGGAQHGGIGQGVGAVDELVHAPGQWQVPDPRAGNAGA